jgi:hypothetical protein
MTRPAELTDLLTMIRASTAAMAEAIALLHNPTEGKMDFTVINGPADPPATVAQIAAMEFEGVKPLSLSKEKRLAQIRDLVQKVYWVTEIAGEICRLDKAELIEIVRENYDIHGPKLMMLAQAADAAKDIREVIQSAECRLAVALAVIEGDGGEDCDPTEDGTAA